MAPPDARAQTAKDESVKERPRAEFDPLGIELDELLAGVGLLSREAVEGKTTPFASFNVLPKVNAVGRWESNIFRVESGSITDRIGIISPAVTIASDWDNHSLSTTLSADFGRWSRTTTENYDDLHMTIGGGIDITESLKTTGIFRLERLHEGRGGIDDPGSGVRPLTYLQPSMTLGAEYMADAILLKPTIDVTQFSYDSAVSLDPLTSPPDTKLRDRTDYKIKNRFGYEFQPGTIAFVEPGYLRRDFRRERDRLGFLQDSSVYQVLTGLTWDVSSITFIDFGVGLLHQKFDEPGFKSITAPAFSLTGIWNATELVTLTAKGESYTSDTTQGGVSSVLVNRLTLTLDYEVFDNLVATWSGYGEMSTFEQQEPPQRQDLGYGTKLGLDYLIGRNFTTGVAVGWATLDSNTFGRSWVNRTGEVRFGVRL